MFCKFKMENIEVCKFFNIWVTILMSHLSKYMLGQWRKLLTVGIIILNWPPNCQYDVMVYQILGLAICIQVLGYSSLRSRFSRVSSSLRVVWVLKLHPYSIVYRIRIAFPFVVIIYVEFWFKLNFRSLEWHPLLNAKKFRFLSWVLVKGVSQFDFGFQKKVQEDGRLLPEFADDEEREWLQS